MISTEKLADGCIISSKLIDSAISFPMTAATACVSLYTTDFFYPFASQAARVKIPANCPNCGAPGDHGRISCAYCGTPYPAD